MAEDNVIDLRQQIVDLFNKEEMLAFFDFTLRVGASETATGLCKISRPKSGKSQAQYYSMLFMIDTSTEEIRMDVGRHMGSVNWEGLANEIPGIESVMSMRGVDLGPTVYFQETDVYVKKGTDITPRTIVGDVYPAVVKAAGLRAGELVLWEDLPVKNKAGESNVPAAGQSVRSPLKGIRELLARMGS